MSTLQSPTTVDNAEAVSNPRDNSGIIHFQDGRTVAAYVAIIGEKPYVSVQWEESGPFQHINWDTIDSVERVDQ